MAGARAAEPAVGREGPKNSIGICCSPFTDATKLFLASHVSGRRHLGHAAESAAESRSAKKESQSVISTARGDSAGELLLGFDADESQSKCPLSESLSGAPYRWSLTMVESLVKLLMGSMVAARLSRLSKVD